MYSEVLGKAQTAPPPTKNMHVRYKRVTVGTTLFKIPLQLGREATQ